MMNSQVVTDAVRTLRSRGERISVRAVHGLTGGSVRDLSRLLRDAGEYLAAAEIADLNEKPTVDEGLEHIDGAVEITPRVGAIAVAREALERVKEARRVAYRRTAMRADVGIPFPCRHGTRLG